MLCNPIEWWRKRAKEKAKAEAARNEAFWKEHEMKKSLALCECSLRDCNFVMKPCPIRDGNRCFKECVHFQKAYIHDFTGVWDSRDICIRINNPRCKLWGRGND